MPTLHKVSRPRPSTLEIDRLDEKRADMKKIALIGAAVLAIIIGLFMWSLSGASDSNAPTDIRTIDVSPQL